VTSSRARGAYRRADARDDLLSRRTGSLTCAAKLVLETAALEKASARWSHGADGEVHGREKGMEEKG
jgi:hypothetical protein